jgi:hypothetical protein
MPAGTSFFPENPGENALELEKNRENGVETVVFT